MSLNWISIKQIRISSVFFLYLFIASTIITLAIPMFVVFHLQRKLNFVVALICSMKNTTRIIFCVCAVFSSILSAVWSPNSKTSLPKFYLHPKSSTVKSYPITFLSCCFFLSLFSSLNLKTLYGWVSCPYLVLWKKNLFLYSSDARLLVLFVQMIWTLVPFLPLLSFEFGP